MPDIGRGQATVLFNLSNLDTLNELAITVAGVAANTFNLVATSVVTNELVMSPAGVATFSHPSGAGLVLFGVQQDTKLVRFDSDVSFRVDVAFDQTGLLETFPPWTSVSTDVRNYHISRGRSNELDQDSPATLNVELDNDDGLYDNHKHANRIVDPMQQIRVQAVKSGTTYDLYRGYVTTWPLALPVFGKYRTVHVDAVDAQKVLNMGETTSTFSTATPDAMVNDLLDDVSWPAELRNISTSTFALDAVDGGNRSVLSLIRDAERSDGGHFLIGKDGKATYHARAYRTTTTVSGRFTFSTFPSSGTHYSNIEPVFDEEQLWNRVVVTHRDGTVLQSESTSSHDLYGIRTLPINGVICSEFNQSVLAISKNGVYSTPQVRVQTIDFTPQVTDSQTTQAWDTALAAEVDNQYVVLWPTTAGGSFPSEWIDYITHDVDARSQTWDTTFVMSPYQF